jgi:hypothetical protein
MASLWSITLYTTMDLLPRWVLAVQRRLCSMKLVYTAKGHAVSTGSTMDKIVPAYLQNTKQPHFCWFFAVVSTSPATQNSHYCYVKQSLITLQKSPLGHTITMLRSGPITSQPIPRRAILIHKVPLFILSLSLRDLRTKMCISSVNAKCPYYHILFKSSILTNKSCISLLIISFITVS